MGAGSEDQPHLDDGSDDLISHIAIALPGVDRLTARRLAAIGRVRPFRRDELIFRQGEAIPFTIVLRGHAAFRRLTADGQVVTLGIAPPNYVIGFGSMSGVVSGVDLIGLTRGEFATWSGAEVRALAADDPGFALDVIDRLVEYLAILTAKVDGFLHQDSRRRVLRILARHRDLFFGEPPILSRSHLHGLVGTSREMTARVLRNLEREGTVVRVGRTGLRLLRPERLEELDEVNALAKSQPRRG
jgi:CRP-like cAMP-binding protein